MPYYPRSPSSEGAEESRKPQSNAAAAHRDHTSAVRVVVRIRTFTDAEVEREEEQVVHPRQASGSGLPDTVFLQPPGTEFHDIDGKDTLKFKYDWVLSKEATQQATFKALGEGIVDSIHDGFHGCIFAYGQTGSGKSHTIFGNLNRPEEHGLMPRICDSIFTDLGQGTSPFLVTLSYLEIYNEKVRDLLRPPVEGEATSALELRQHPKVGVFVDGLSRNAISSFMDVLRLLDFGNKMRTVAATNLNAVSSRSHAVLTLHVDRAIGGCTEAGGVTRKSQLHLYDVAGSEQLPSLHAGQEQMTESKYINTSLWALGLMINGLADAADGTGDATYVPYRSSKLTHLLADSLKGSCRTVMIACCSPAASSHDVTERTLRLASRARHVRTRPAVHEEIDGALVTLLRAETKELRSQLNDAIASEQKKMIQANIDLTSLLQVDLSMTPEEWQLQTRSADKERHRTLQDLGLSTVSWANWMRGERIQAENNNTPCLVNVCSDPLLSGCLLYSLPQEQVVRIGSDATATIQIDGLGVQLQMCQIVNRGHELIDLIVSESTAGQGSSTKSLGLFKTGFVQVFVNNRPVVGQVHLHHNDCIRAGSSHSFRLLTEDIERLSSLVGVTGVVSAAAEDGGLYKHCGHLEQLQERYGRQKATAILSKLQGVLPLIEEANELTAELRADKDFQLRFRGEVCSDVTGADKDPEIVVVLRQSGRQQDSGDMVSTPPQNCVRCLWTVDKFRRRLEVMRDIYHVVTERGDPWGWDDDPNPWMDEAQVPLVNPAFASTRAPAPGKMFEVDASQAMAANAALQAEVDRLRSQLSVQRDELEINASLRNKLVQDVVAAQRETSSWEARYEREEAAKNKQAQSVIREEEVLAHIKPGWLNVLGALRERRSTIEEPQMHKWLEPHERLSDYAQKLTTNLTHFQDAE